MPPKNYELGSGTLYFDNGEIVGEIQEVSLECEDAEIVANDMPLVKLFKQLGEASFEATMSFSNLQLLTLLLGRKITNNWLKMHGGVMTRRRRR